METESRTVAAGSWGGNNVQFYVLWVQFQPCKVKRVLGWTVVVVSNSVSELDATELHI